MLSLGLFVILIAVSTALVYRTALDKAATERAEELSIFFKARLAQLERDWELASRDFRIRIEYTRILEDKDRAKVNLQAFITVQGGDRQFQYLIIQDQMGHKIIDFGNDFKLASIPLPPEANDGHYFDAADNQFYRVFQNPIWLGEKAGVGRIAVFYRIDNALLRQLSAPGITLSLLHDRVPVASSGGQIAIERLLRGVPTEGAAYRLLPWTGDPDDGVKLHMDAPVRPLFSASSLTAGMSAIPILDALILWFSIGMWLIWQTKRIIRLRNAVDVFSANGEITPAFEACLTGAAADRHDEISQVAHALHSLANTTVVREEERARLQQRVQERTCELEIANQATAEALAYNQTIIAASPIGIALYDQSGQCVLANQAAPAIIGTNHQAYLDQNYNSLDSWRQSKIIDTALEAIDLNQSVRREHHIITSFGRDCWFDLQFTPILLHGQPHLLLMFLDVTEARQAANELREAKEFAEQTAQSLDQSERLIRTITDHMPGVVGYWDNKLYCRFANDGYHTWLGINPRTMIGKNMADLFPSSFFESIKPKLTEAFSGITQSFEYTVTTPSGIQADFWAQYIPDFGQDGIVLGIVVLALEITDRKRAEAQIRQLNTSLERRVVIRTAQLEAANAALVTARDAAEAGSRVKSEFLALISHEIRTPMNAIIGMANLLAGTSLDERQKKHIDIMLSASNILLNLINDILDISKIEADKIELESTLFSLDDVIEESVSYLTITANDKNVALLTDVDANAPKMLRGDPLRLQQILTNLISNAVKFTDQGTIEIIVKLKAQDNHNALVTFAVRDTGIGIDVSGRDRLFEAFTQADTSTTRLYGGTGLGLAIASRLVRLMGGELMVESELGRGSTFFFTIPLAQPECYTPKST